MKFTKEQAFENLKGFLTNNGKKTLRMSEKSINRQLETLMPLIANDEMELADFVEKVKPTFETMNSNAEKDNSDFVKQWEKDHPVTNPTKQTGTTDGNDELLKSMQEQLDALKQEQAENKRNAAISQKRTDLVSAMMKEGVKDKKWIDSFLGEVTITENLDVEAKAKAYVKFYNKDKAGTPPNVTPNGSGSAGNEKMLDAINRAAALAKQERALASATVE